MAGKQHMIIQNKMMTNKNSITGEGKIIFNYLGNSNCLPLNSLWTRLLDFKYKCILEDNSESILLDDNIKILTYNPVSFDIENKSPTCIMRHKFKGDVINIRTDYHNIRMTKDHHLIDIVDNKIIKITPYSPDVDRVWYCHTDYEIYPLKIKEIYNEYYDGYVYNFEVSETHNFIINGILLND